MPSEKSAAVTLHGGACLLICAKDRSTCWTCRSLILQARQGHLLWLKNWTRRKAFVLLGYFKAIWILTHLLGIMSYELNGPYSLVRMLLVKMQMFSQLPGSITFWTNIGYDDDKPVHFPLGSKETQARSPIDIELFKAILSRSSQEVRLELLPSLCLS